MCDPLGIDGGGGKCGCNRLSLIDVGMRLEDRIWRGGEKGEDLQSAFLLPWPE